MCELDNVIVLQDEVGEDVEFEFLDLVELEGAEYVVLSPIDDEGEGSEVIVLKVEECEDDEVECYSTVDDEGLLMRVFGIFKDRFKEVYDFAE